MSEIIYPPESKLNETVVLDRLAVRYRGATGPGMALMAKLGDHADGLAEYIPKSAQHGIHVATEKALHTAIRAADMSHKVLPSEDARLTRLVAAAMGAVGGVGGIGTALAELPLTTTLFLRSIQAAARQEGFDPKADNVRFDSVRIFASNGPLTSDETDLAFMAARMAVGGPTLQALATQVAPRLALVFGKKVAAQALPVLGAAAGASINTIYANYYREMAHVHFGLRRLAIETDQPIEQLTKKLEARVA
ncbi:MAG: EcsC family protein [Paracoccaceae bacterium]|nr:EcsC family protein [Paracoccaceae bacterium]MDG1736707.1 EcsC family protein [Paracoccaceae bacterium]MDG2257538.1 EcsC family protein [Paracoccaceae bacterium]